MHELCELNVSPVGTCKRALCKRDYLSAHHQSDEVMGLAWLDRELNLVSLSLRHVTMTGATYTQYAQYVLPIGMRAVANTSHVAHARKPR